MFHNKLLALVGGVMALALLSAQPALAQTAPEEPGRGDDTTARASGNIRGERVQPGRRRQSQLCTALCLSLVIIYRKYAGARDNDFTARG